MSELITLSKEQLRLHPKNIRLYYAPKEIEEMAASLAAVGLTQEAGNIQALLVVAIPESPEHYYVVDGNLRLTAGRSLGEACPPFKVEVIQASEADQLLMMAASGVTFPKDPISQGRHYKRLIKEEGFTQGSIAEHTGLSTATIGKCLAALELDEEIQELFIQKQLPSDIRIIRGLKNIPDQETRLRIARYYAGREVPIGSIAQRIRKLAEKAHHLNGTGAEFEAKRAKIKANLRQANESRLNKKQAKSSLELESARNIQQAAERILCQGCSLTGLGDKCGLCPGPVEFLAHLGEMIEAATAGPEEETKTVNIKLVSPEMVRERVNGLAA